MASMIFDMTVHYEDGHTEEVRADQRDCAVFERQEKMGTMKALEDMTFVFLRHITYSALVRTGRVSAKDTPRAAWEASVIEVEPDDDEEADALPNSGDQGTPDTD